MLPLIAVGVAAVAAGTAAWKTYQSYTTQGHKAIVGTKLGKFTIWGRPNAGKTTFVNRLVKDIGPASKKEGTTGQKVYKDVKFSAAGQQYLIDEIRDMPGTIDRQSDWLESVKTHDHVFYLFNSSNEDRNYLAQVRDDISKAVETLKNCTKSDKRLHIIASHVDQSRFKEIDPAEVNNVLQEDDNFIRLYQSTAGVSGYVYAVNLTSDENSRMLMESIMRDHDV